MPAQLLEKAERLREKATTDDQRDLDRLMEKVRVALNDRQWPIVQTAGDELADVLFYLEDA